MNGARCVAQAGIDAGERSGLKSEERKELSEPCRENKRLREDNAMAKHQGGAKEMIGLFDDAHDVIDDAKAASKDRLKHATTRRPRLRFSALIEKARVVNRVLLEHKRDGIDKDAHNLLVRLETYATEVLRVGTDFNVACRTTRPSATSVS
ncbi:MAG: hypothetical protein M0T79_03060 [Actinomycetota bacterium]|nr:hypothetical protein [Actinomycetota bacterium]